MPARSKWGREGFSRESCENPSRPHFAVSGVNAAYVGFTTCSSCAAISGPRPSLPVCGTDNPPVASTTASASIGAASWRSTTQRPCAGRTSVMNVLVMTVTPARRAYASSASRTSRARCDAGKSFADPASSTSGRRRWLSKNAICSYSGHDRTIRRRRCRGESVTKRDSSSRAGRILQRPPPLIRILRPPSFVRSRSSVSAPPSDAAKIAAIVPAAPAPMTTTRGMLDGQVGLAKRQIEAPFELELCRRRAGRNARHAVIAQTRGAAEHERVTRFECDGLDRIASLEAAEQKSRRVANRHRHHGNARADRLPPFILVLTPSHAAVPTAVVEDAEIGFEAHAGVRRDVLRQRTKLRRRRRSRKAVEVVPRCLVLIRLCVPVTPEAEHSDMHLATAADDRYVGRHRSVDQRAAHIRDRALPIDREKA